MLDLYAILENFISPTLAALLVLIVCSFWLSVSSKWKQFFLDKKEFYFTVVIVLLVVFLFFQMPIGKYQQRYRGIIIIVLTVFLIYQVYKKDHKSILGKILCQKWNKIYKLKGTFLYKLCYACLSVYEKKLVDLEEVRMLYSENPYKAYCQLEALDISGCNENIQRTYSYLLGTILIEMGAYSEATAIIEEVYKNNPDSLKVHSMLSVIYDHTGKNEKAMQLAQEAYYKTIASKEKIDFETKAEIYHNYAVFLINARQINRGLDIAKEAADFSLKQESLSFIHMAVRDYLKLALQFKQVGAVSEYLKKYQKSLGEECDLSMPYINTKLYIMRMGYPLGNIEEYIIHIYDLNKNRLGTEGKCFLCLTCTGVAFEQDIKIDYFLKEILSLLKNECNQLETMKRLRFYDMLESIVVDYPIYCNKNQFQKSESFDEIKIMVDAYNEFSKKQDIEKMLNETDSIWIHQKCELRNMNLNIQRKKKYDFDKIYEEYLQLYKERELGNDLRSMLNIDMAIIYECEITVNLVNLYVPLHKLRSAKVDVINKHLQDAERLLDIINYDTMRETYALRMSRGYVFAGDFEKAREHLKVFKDANIPESFLNSKEREYLQVLTSIL